jgi:23S rRNA (cytidine1920-2'-O)/16S rRNA (cytidine1409-2'-O)-methyltransferase
MKERLDVLVAARGLAESREQAQRVIRAGQVRVAGQVCAKPGLRYDSGAAIEVEAPPRYVSRGGEKLEAALAAFHIRPAGRVCLDVGASTGGFTDCLLQHGAARVYAVDVGKGQLHWKLREDPRVVVMESINARHMTAGALPERPTLATVDVSFISLTLILPAVKQIVTAPAGFGELVTLIKPQFEAGRKDVAKGGVVRDEEVRRRVVETVRAFGEGTMGFTWLGVIESPLKGPAGNTEYLAYWRIEAERGS